MNSPGGAGRAPAATNAATASAGTSNPPWVNTSTMSSPVYERGAAYQATSGSSIKSPAAVTRLARRMVRAASGNGRRQRAATSRTPVPDNRITATAERPGGVARATIGSDNTAPPTPLPS